MYVQGEHISIFTRFQSRSEILKSRSCKALATDAITITDNKSKNNGFIKVPQWLLYCNIQITTCGKRVCSMSEGGASQHKTQARPRVVINFQPRGLSLSGQLLKGS